MDKKVVRASYESCLDATARLAAYVTSRPFSEALEVNERQDILATDDLITFCIHARRLIKNVGLEKEFLDKFTVTASDGNSLSLWKIIGWLIHHNTLAILRCDTQFRILTEIINGTPQNRVLKNVKSDNKRLYSEATTPHIVFQSDQTNGMKMINLVTFIRIFSQEILPEVIRKALNEDLCLLDDPFRDVDISEDGRQILRQES